MTVNIVFFIIALGASVIGAICGVGGGVIIKPVLDLLEISSVSTASFLSSCTVLAMTSYSTTKSFISKNNVIDTKSVVPLAVGAALGGVCGKYLFEFIKDSLSRADKIASIQAVFIGLVALGTMLYTVNKNIITKKITNGFVILIMGLVLGIMSSFLGIGGGPVDMVVLLYFFSMPTKVAAQNSLFIILLSQLSSIIYTIFAGKIPDFSYSSLILMIIGGVAGGIIGRILNQKISEKTVERLFVILLGIIILVSIYNFYRYT